MKDPDVVVVVLTTAAAAVGEGALIVGKAD